MTDKTETTILLDIYERLGAIETKLEMIKEQEHEPRIAKLEQFENKVSAYIWLGGSIVSGVLFFLWEGIKYGLEHWVRQ
jgi:hypothetical protein